MPIVTIPFDYNPLRDVQIVPICMQDTDCEDCPIDRRWFEAVVPIAEPLRKLSKRVLYDVWRVSELTEMAVHALWRKHLYNLGRNPSSQIYAQASWTAKDLAAGGRNNRRGVNVELYDSLLAKLRSTSDVHREVSAEELREAIRRELRERGMAKTDEVFDMYLYGHRWNEIAEVLGKKPKAATKEFWRRINRVLEDLNLR